VTVEEFREDDHGYLNWVPRPTQRGRRGRGPRSHRSQGPRAPRDGGDTRTRGLSHQREMTDLRLAQVDLQRCRFKIADAKTEAGIREVEITLYLRDELLTYLMDRRARGLPVAPSDHFFGTATGKRRDPDPFRDRIFARAVARATRTASGAGCRRWRRSHRTRLREPGPRSAR
jgi:hypothetical protein